MVEVLTFLLADVDALLAEALDALYVLEAALAFLAVADFLVDFDA